LNFKIQLCLLVFLLTACGLKGSPRAPLDSYIPSLEQSYADQMNSGKTQNEDISKEKQGEPTP